MSQVWGSDDEGSSDEDGAEGSAEREQREEEELTALYELMASQRSSRQRCNDESDTEISDKDSQEGTER